MRFPWWILKSWTFWCCVVAVGLTFVPVVREKIRQGEVNFVWLQSFAHVLLRFKTEQRRTKLSNTTGPLAWSPKEEG